MLGWCITKEYGEYLDEFGIESRVGYGQTDNSAVEETANTVWGRTIYVRTDLKASDIDNAVKFRLYNDDRELDYSGIISKDWLEGEEYLAFAPLEFATTDVGSTYMMYLDPEGGEWVHL